MALHQRQAAQDQPSDALAAARHRLLKKGQHWTRKTPGCTRSDILWHAIRCELALGRVPH